MEKQMRAELRGTVFDRDLALSHVDGDSGLLKEIAGLFLGEYPNSLRELRGAIARGDAELAERTAHTLKGSVSNFGARAAQEAAREIEDLGREHKLTETAPAMQHLELALAALRSELERL